MSFTITHRLGQMEPGSKTTDLVALLAELNAGDSEHGDVAVASDSGWSLSAHANGNVTLENLEEGEPSHMQRVDRKKVLELMRLMAADDIEAVQREAWQPGYPA